MELLDAAQDNPVQALVAVAAVVLLTDRLKETTKKSKERIEKLEKDMEQFKNAGAAAAQAVASK